MGSMRCKELERTFTYKPPSPRKKWKATGLWVGGTGKDLPGWNPKGEDEVCDECKGTGGDWIEKGRKKRRVICNACNGTRIRRRDE